EPANLQLFTLFPNGPILPLTFFQEIPIGTDIVIFQELNWQQQEVCSTVPCTVDFTYGDDCGVVSFDGQSSISNSPSWEWTFAGGNPSTSSFQDPVVSFQECGLYKIC